MPTLPAKPTPAQIDAALKAVQDSVRGATDYWDFIAHRKRYRSDALRIGEHRAAEGRGTPLLEVGAFPYHLTVLLRHLGYPAVAVDLQPERLAERIRQHGLDVRRCDIERQPLPFPSGTFELVVCNEVLEHLRYDPLFTLSEINRVMRPGATLLLTTPNLYAAQRIAKFLLGRGFNDPLAEFAKLRGVGHMGHIREYSAREVRRLLGYAGFAVHGLEFEHYHYPPGKRGLATRLVFAMLPRCLRSFQIVVATKQRPGPGLSPLDAA